MSEIKQGYKQTEVGVIPEDWEVKTLGDVSEIKTGPFGSTLHSSDYVIFGTPIITVEHIGTQKVNKRLDIPQVCVSDKERLKSYLLKEGDIVFSRVGSVDRNSLITKEEEGWLFSGRLLRIRNVTKYDSVYLSYYLNTSKVKSLIFSVAVGQTMPSLNTKILNGIPIILPRITEQTAIATALSDVDSLISALNKKIEKKKNIKQGAMQQLLTGKKRLEGFSGEWVEKKLGEVLEYEQPTKYIVKGTEYIESGIPVLTAGKSFILGYTNEQDSVFTDTPVIIFDDFTTATKFVDFQFKIKSSAMKILKLKSDNYNIKFVFEIMQIIDFPLSDHQRYWISEYSKIIAPIPSIAEQNAIAQILSDMDNEIIALETKRDKYVRIKSGMMQELLTGNIRLVESVGVKTKIAELKPKKAVHSEQINEAVVISFLVHKFGTKDFPLSRFRYTKYAYLLHRQYEHEAAGFKKHVAGPYKPANRYKGPEDIALKNKYLSKVENAKSGKDAFIVSENIEKALSYFTEWYGTDMQKWIEQFRFYKNDYLEVLTTVDESICDLKKQNIVISAGNIKNYIASIKQWKAKLDKPYFNDFNIQKAINESYKLFGE